MNPVSSIEHRVPRGFLDREIDSTTKRLLSYKALGENRMLGAIAGDIIGSVYEANPVKTTDFLLFSEFSRFTDDTVLTIATAHALMEGMGYAKAYRQFGRRYPGAGYGGSVINWLRIDEAPPYSSWGNGLPMPITGKFRKPLEKK
jgi:hypothetical protein